MKNLIPYLNAYMEYANREKFTEEYILTYVENLINAGYHVACFGGKYTIQLPEENYQRLITRITN